jgi:nucleotide-binding universal stress UspA family protein
VHELEQQAKRELRCQPRYAVSEGDPADAILEVAKNRKANLIVLGVRKPDGNPERASHFPTTITHKVIAHAACPVLTVRSGTR